MNSNCVTISVDDDVHIDTNMRQRFTLHTAPTYPWQ